MSAGSEAADLLVEIGTEELPPTSLRGLMNAFATELGAGLDKAGLAHGDIQAFASPRRLALIVHQLARAQPTTASELKGPPLTVAYDGDGKPTRAALAFAAKCGVAVEALETIESDKGAWLGHRRTVAGAGSAELLPTLIDEALAALPIARRMRWGAGDAQFARPVHWAVLMHGAEVIDAAFFEQPAGRTTYGHRFHAPSGIELADPAQYATRLETQGFVIADFAARRARIEAQIEAAAKSLNGNVADDDALLDEVTALVEWPVAVCGSFAERFLALPVEVLASSLKKHQRYFPVHDDAGGLMARFVTIANIDSKDPAAVAAGNERVIAPRLADAEFFWNSDTRESLASRAEQLRSVVYENELGSVFDKARRVARLAVHLATVLDEDTAAAERAAELARCDLVTGMVGEFPDLQGVMGSHYARHDGEPANVCEAIAEFYRPAFAGDAIAESPTGRIIVIADRLDTLAGAFVLGRKPSGHRDPYGLRRAALGVARTIIEGELEFNLFELLEAAVTLQPLSDKPPTLVDELYDFIVERLRAYFHDTDPTISTGVFEAVNERRPPLLVDFRDRLRAVVAFAALPEAESLAAANKRIGNILRQAAGDTGAAVDIALLSNPTEKTLYQRFAAVRQQIAPLIARRDYTAALATLAELREPVDRFFDDVMVMTEDIDERRNRLGMLTEIRGQFLEIADISLLSGT